MFGKDSSLYQSSEADSDVSDTSRWYPHSHTFCHDVGSLAYIAGAGVPQHRQDIRIAAPGNVKMRLNLIDIWALPKPFGRLYSLHEPGVVAFGIRTYYDLSSAEMSRRFYNGAIGEYPSCFGCLRRS